MNITPTPTIEVPNFQPGSTASIETFIDFLGKSIPTASQTVDSSNVIKSRTYKEYSLLSNKTYIQEINLGAYDPKYQSNLYYLVSTDVKETLYCSDNTWIDPSDPNYFLRWRMQESIQKLQVTVLNKTLRTVEVEVPLVNGVVYTLNTSEAVKANVVASLPVQIKNGPTVVSNSFLLIYPEINISYLNPITLNPNAAPTLLKITITLIGQKAWSVMMPVGLPQTSTLIHPVETSLSTRLLPPHKQFAETFWNTNPPTTVINDYLTR